MSRRLSSRFPEPRPLGVTTVAVGIGLLSMLPRVQIPGTWIATHWAFSYPLTLRRSLVGSIVALVRPDDVLTRTFVAVAGAAVILVYVLLAAALVGRASSCGAPIPVLMAGALLLTSSHARALATDSGRFDGMLLIITLIIAHLTIRTRPGGAGTIALAILGPIGILVHEIYLISGLPLAIALIWSRIDRSSRSEHRARQLTWLGIATVPSVLTGVALALSPRPSGPELVRISEMMSSQTEFLPNPSSLAVHSAGLLDGIRAVAAALLGGGISSALIILLLMLPGLGLGVLLLGLGPIPRPADVVARNVLFGAALAPLLLSVIGVDWGRWTVFAVLNLAVANLHVQGGSGEGPAQDLARPILPFAVLLMLLVAILPSPEMGGLNGSGLQGFGGFEGEASEVLQALRSSITRSMGWP